MSGKVIEMSCKFIKNGALNVIFYSKLFKSVYGNLCTHWFVYYQSEVKK